MIQNVLGGDDIELHIDYSKYSDSNQSRLRTINSRRDRKDRIARTQAQNGDQVAIKTREIEKSI